MKAMSLAWALCVCAFLVVSPCHGSAQDEELDISRGPKEIRASGRILIGVYDDKFPFGYIDENGDRRGYDIYFAKRIGRDLGVEIEWVPVAPSERVSCLLEGRADIVLASFTVTPQRAAQVDFALPYMKVTLAVISPNDDIITDMVELHGRTLIVCRGTTAEAWVEAVHPEIDLLKFDEWPDAWDALQTGKGVALCGDNADVFAWALAHEGFTVGIPSIGRLSTIAPGVRKGNVALKEWINEEIRRLGMRNFFHTAYAETLASVFGKSSDLTSLVVEGGQVRIAR